MTNESHYSLKPRRVGQYASTLEASWALHLRSMCEVVEYAGACYESFDFLVESDGRKIAVEIKPQLNDDTSAEDDRWGIPDIVYQAASRAYRKQCEQISLHGLVVTLIATGYPEDAKWFLVLSEVDDRRYRHRHLRGSKLISDDINIRSLSDYTIYSLSGAPEFGGCLSKWITAAVNQNDVASVDIHDPQPLEARAQSTVSDKRKRKLANRARQAANSRRSS
ncbi:hypothetical protein AB833_14920 [Chromatiales bacterium (ex Bugula neritina AB1)]|nr:hypothetical protein AB833_14920 [Chromatiales bacterium (ex Bugula neritina AB1)]